MGTERPLNRNVVDDLWASPPLGCTKHNGGPAWLLRHTILPRIMLNFADAGAAEIKRGGKLLMHSHRVITRHEIGLIALTTQEGMNIGVGFPSEHRWVRDLVAVEVEDGQHGSVARRV